MNKLYADELKAESEKMRRGEAYDRRVTVSAHALLVVGFPVTVLGRCCPGPIHASILRLVSSFCKRSSGFSYFYSLVCSATIALQNSGFT